MYYNMDDYDFIKFERGTGNKKYNAILKNKTTGRAVRVGFGDVRHQQFKDTAMGLYKKLDHNDENRRRLFRLRHHKNLKNGFYSPSFFSYFFLW